MAIEETNDPGGGFPGHVRVELHRRPHRGLDPRAVGRDPQRLVDPHVVGEANTPSNSADRWAAEEPDGVGARPGVAPFEPVGGVVIEAVEERYKVSFSERTHRLAALLPVGRRDHEIDSIDAAALDRRSDLERIPFEDLDLAR